MRSYDPEARGFYGRSQSKPVVDYFHGTVAAARPDSRNYYQSGVTTYGLVCRTVDGQHLCRPGQCPNEIAVAFDGDGEMYLKHVENNGPATEWNAQQPLRDQ
jgi:hypothetical protein